jgi:hypothetical protein
VGTTSTLVLVLASLCHVGAELVVVDEVDLIEVNHFYDEQGRHVFDQIIFYDWCGIQCRHNVRAWRLLKSPSQRPHRDWDAGGHVAVWHDGNFLRRVRSHAVRESWTQYDPELVERDFVPKEQRPDLHRPRLVRVPELLGPAAASTLAR